MTNDPKIVARSLADAERELPELDREYAVVSIGSPRAKIPAGVDPDQPYHLRLQFDDVNSDTPLMGRDRVQPPEREHIEELLEHADRLLSKPVVYCHCAAGISRSTAAAFILHCHYEGPGTEQEAMQAVLDDNPFASPNRLMVEYADELLDREGAMVEAVDAVQRGL